MNKTELVEVTFEYRDRYCKDGKFRTQHAICRSVEECKKFYGLDDDKDCEYRIIEVKPHKTNGEA